jgi:hypothetical protein
LQYQVCLPSPVCEVLVKSLYATHATHGFIPRLSNEML